MLGETSYNAYRNDETQTSKQKVNKAIKNINSKLYEIDRVLTHNIKLKNETGVDSTKYWKGTRKTLFRISEKMQQISEKLRRF
jgi:aromatic ring-opening dioxygenase LigB subunit